MVNRLINLRLPEQMLQEVKDVVKKGRYHSSTDFIREAIRKSLDYVDLQHDLLVLKSLQGSQKKLKVPFTKKERMKTFNEFVKKTSEERQKVWKKFGLEKIPMIKS